ncbi:MAG: hypothetical protein V3S82_05810 [Dehalococcoidia bacterium]
MIEKETHAGKILVINDNPRAGGGSPLWKARPMYHYTLVDSAQQAEVLSGLMDFDAIVHIGDFLFRSPSLSYYCR